MARDCYVAQFVEHPIAKEADGVTPKRGAMVFHTENETKARAEQGIDRSVRHLFVFEGAELVEESGPVEHRDFLRAKVGQAQRNRVEAYAAQAEAGA